MAGQGPNNNSFSGQAQGTRGVVGKLREREFTRMKTKKLYHELTEVEFVGFNGLPRDLEFVFHLVDNARALKKIVIDPKFPNTTPYVYSDREAVARERVQKLLAHEVPWKIKVDYRSPF